ncbi:POK18 protein, partial [Steatornis caripensis]|nr:POK18 protein [Steatornis caripensis]
FAFSVPSINRAAPAERYEWVVLRQGMKNSPTLCQMYMYVAWALQPLRRLWPHTIIYHYMDDILCCQKDPWMDVHVQQIAELLKQKGLFISPEKIQRQAPWKYLGWTIENAKIRPQKLELKTDLATLNDVQKFLGDVQWVRNCVGITNEDISPLAPLLRGTHPAAPICITPEQSVAIQRIVDKLH